MNGWAKWAGIVLGTIGLIGGHMLFVADGRYFPFREGVELAQQQKTDAKISQEVLQGFRELKTRQVDLEKQYLRDRNERQETEMERMKEKIRRLQSRPRAQ